jgi:NADH:ubiquinone oxidoreductase subunit F (NADH-binding)
VSAAGPAAAAGRPAATAPRHIPRLIPADGPLALAEHLARCGPPPLPQRDERRTGAALIAEVDRSGLTGRGGAGFPAGRKMRAVAAAAAARPLRSPAAAVVIANGAESEPSSEKDRILLGRAPHLVLDGLALAAEAVGAGRGYLCLHSGTAAAMGPLNDAVASRERAGLDRMPVEIVAVPGGYVASQETALVNFLNGAAALPGFVPPRPAQRGAHRRPTLVQNVETLAHLALIARYGADWFRELGTAAAPGTALVTLSGAVRRPGVYEIALGSPLAAVLQRAGGPAEPAKAVLAGGFFGGWLPLPAAGGTALSGPALRAAGAAFGPGVLAVLPESSCGLAETARVTRYLAGQSAGQCGPCSNGLPALADAMAWIAFGQPGSDVLGWTEHLMALITGRGACHLPDGTAGLVASALRVFDADLRQHARSGPCPLAGRAPVLALPGTALPGIPADRS